MVNGWPELLVESSAAKPRLAALTSEARRLQALTVTSDADMTAAVQQILTWRESARSTLAELFEATADRFQPEIATHFLAAFKTPVERFTAAHGILVEDVLHIIVLATWIDSTGGKPMAMSPAEMIAQVKAKHQPQTGQGTTASPQPQSPIPAEKIGVIGWARRATAFALHVAFWCSVFGWWDANHAYRHLLANVPTIAGISGGTFVALLAIIWAAYLTQLKLGWLFLLPLYLAAVPPLLLIKWVGGTVFGPLFRAAQRAVNPAANVPTYFQGERRRQRQRILWLVLWVVWFVALRKVDAPWIFWVPAVLTLPLWYYGIKWSLTSAMAPPSVTLAAVNFCSRQLDSGLTAWPTRTDKERKSAANTFALLAIIGAFLSRRYSGTAKLITIQREAIIVFSTVLLAAFGMSCVWFGLLAEAIVHTWPTALAAYNFFGSASLLECTLWALGCMTTAVGFPSSTAPTWVKVLHAFILLTGIFQVTYLLACFSIISATEASRVSDRATVSVAELDTKVSMVLAIRESFEARAKAGA